MIGISGMQILCHYLDSIHSKNIKYFNVSCIIILFLDSGIGNEGVIYLCQSLSSLASPKLIELSIADYKYSDNRITSRGLKTLFQLFEQKKLQTVESLDISGSFFEGDIMKYFCTLIQKHYLNNIKKLYMKGINYII